MSRAQCYQTVFAENYCLSYDTALLGWLVCVDNCVGFTTEVAEILYETSVAFGGFPNACDFIDFYNRSFCPRRLVHELVHVHSTDEPR